MCRLYFYHFYVMYVKGGEKEGKKENSKAMVKAAE